MSKVNIFSITNQKGGVGKTTTAVNLSASIAAFGKRVLLVDLDPQANATTGAGINKFELENSICEVLLGEAKIADTVVTNPNSKFDVLPANPELTTVEVALINKKDRAQIFKKKLKKIKNDYDYVLIDCPPALNLLTVNALTASNGVIVPLQCEFYSLEGISALIDTVNQIAATVNPNLAIVGVVRTMYDGRNNLAVQVSEQLALHFSKEMYDTIIPRNVRLAEAPSYGIPITEYDASSKGAFAYMDLAAEILQRTEG